MCSCFNVTYPFLFPVAGTSCGLGPAIAYTSLMLAKCLLHSECTPTYLLSSCAYSLSVPQFSTMTAADLDSHHSLFTLTISSLTAQHNALPAMIPSKNNTDSISRGTNLAPNSVTCILPLI